MFDSSLRALKDQIFDPVSQLVPHSVSPLLITFLAFVCGILGCVFAANDCSFESLIFWIFNRGLDCLDGAVARHHNQASDLGGFLDLLGDFIVYSLIPIACGLSSAANETKSNSLWMSIAVVEASFHINNFVLFYIAAVVEKQKVSAMVAERRSAAGEQSIRGANDRVSTKKELTSLVMRASLIEGMESAILFTMMLAKPAWLEHLCWWMAALVAVGILDRTIFTIIALKK